MTLSTIFIIGYNHKMSRIDPATTMSLLFDFISRSKREWWHITEKYGFTPLQLHIMELLADKPMRMSNLCNSLVCDASNVTGIVDRLSAHGWIERRDHPEDRRIKMVSLTAKGREERNKVLPKIAAEGVKLLEPLTTAELEQFNAILRKLSAKQVQ